MGMSGLEFAFPITWALVEAGHISETELVRRWTVEPARILRVEQGTLIPGRRRRRDRLRSGPVLDSHARTP